jgi:predicted SAM-dependent methyltransferase
MFTQKPFKIMQTFEHLTLPEAVKALEECTARLARLEKQVELVGAAPSSDVELLELVQELLLSDDAKDYIQMFGLVEAGYFSSEVFASCDEEGRYADVIRLQNIRRFYEAYQRLERKG